MQSVLLKSLTVSMMCLAQIWSKYKDLQEECQNISISLTEEQAVTVEKQSRGQATSKLSF